ncbi:autotransporter outer membrane beta-barrel domain-containing protein [Budvicia aquatica]|uniref:Autotransporter outer membrane beta-barrel domain-containing protein n=1 Tax=Budvicia aquatica TaxID=82979 RepID=A0A2C6DNF3_9GAMM|nr:autotransporter outer membrane beta-barrel domain-containing protein [Budvicia aquatica]PHI29852.1 autotransporter outer membrane beta-barrel domain-containing protein [Budvicia aquatica]VFS48470.1 Outer membrane protein IcsA autotransporter precursor [Budvicia aquatica]
MDGGATIERQGAKNLAEVKLGIDGQLNLNISLWTNVAQQIGQYGYRDTRATLGLKYSF